MLYSVKGKLIHTEPGIAVVECGGVGFKCFRCVYATGLAECESTFFTS